MHVSLEAVGALVPVLVHSLWQCLWAWAPGCKVMSWLILPCAIFLPYQVLGPCGTCVLPVCLGLTCSTCVVAVATGQVWLAVLSPTEWQCRASQTAKSLLLPVPDSTA